MRENRALLIRMMRCLHSVDGQYGQLWRSLGIKRSLFVLLCACVDETVRSQKEICEEWCLPRSTLNTVVREQVHAGNVELVPRGNKEKDVRLTKAGQALAERILGPMLDAEEKVARKCLNNGTVEGVEDFAAEIKKAFEPLYSK